MKYPFILLVTLFGYQQLQSQSCDQLNGQSLRLYNSGQIDSAVYIAEYALSVCKNDTSEAGKGYRKALFSVIFLYEVTERYSDAVALHTSWGILNDKSVDFFDNDQLKTGILYAERALDIAIQDFGKKTKQHAGSLLILSYYCRRAGYFKEAFFYAKASMENVPIDVKNYEDYFNNAGSIYQELGFHKEAILEFEGMLEYLSSKKPMDSLKYVLQMRKLAGVYQDIGQIEKAIRLYEKSLEIIKTTSGESHDKYSICLNDLASAYLTAGKGDTAINMFKSALESAKRIYGTTHREYGIRLNNLAAAYLHLGDQKNALNLLNRSLANTKTIFGEKHPEYLQTLGNIGSVYSELEEFEKAWDCYKALLADSNRIHFQHSIKGHRFDKFADVKWKMGEIDTAEELFCKASKAHTASLKSTFVISGEAGRKESLDQVDHIFDIYQSFLFKNRLSAHHLPFLVYNNELMLKSMLLTASTDFNDFLLKTNDSTLTAIYHMWIELKQSLAIKYLNSGIDDKASIDTLQVQYDNLEEWIVKKTEALGSRRWNYGATWKQVQNSLVKSEMAIEFSHFGYYNKKWLDSTLYVAYLTRSNSEYPEMVYLFEEKELEALAAGSAPNSLYGSRGVDELNRMDYSDKGKALYQLVWQNLEPHLEGIETIYFAPSGKLHQIAFAALPDSSGQLLSEKYQLVQVSSTGKLVVADPEPEKAPALMLGGIQYYYDSTQSSPGDSFTQVYNPVQLGYDTLGYTTRGSRGTEWQYLKGTQKETRALYKLYQKTRQASTLVSGTEASEAYVKSLDGKSPKVLHLATHGFFFEDPEEKKNEPLFIGQQPVYTLADDPLMRSGLLLAGANYAWQHGQNPYEEEDGILTAYEISNLNLSNTDLVVLSACETGLGDIEGSEGVYGLQRAFRMAGVEYLIMSLWEVPDHETSEFMQLFYKTWLAGDGIYEAFSHTQRTMAAKYRNKPQLWAGFVLVQ